MFNIKFADDGIETADLWSWKWPLYQLSYNQFFVRIFFNFGTVWLAHKKYIFAKCSMWGDRERIR